MSGARITLAMTIVAVLSLLVGCAEPLQEAPAAAETDALAEKRAQARADVEAELQIAGRDKGKERPVR